ncbi:hypothetical protein MMC30_003104 [Trapelia coarctata]|nr:hypothetical protein [Trapelia coarctata]
MTRATSLLVKLLCIFNILTVLVSAQIPSEQILIGRKHHPECEQRSREAPPMPKAFKRDCHLLIKEQVTSGAGPWGGSTAWREEVFHSPAYSIWSTSSGECAITFGVTGRLTPPTWNTVARGIKSIASICVDEQHRGGTQGEAGVKVYISTRRVLPSRQTSLKAEFGKSSNSQRRPRTRNPELRRRIFEGKEMEGFSVRPGARAPPNSSPPGRSRSLPSSPRAGMRSHPAPQQQVEKSRICARVEQLDPRSLSPEQRAKVKLCCKLGVAACSFAAEALTGGGIDTKLVIPLFAVGSASGLGLAVLGNVNGSHNARVSFASGPSTSSALLHDPSNLVKRTPPPHPSQLGRAQRFDVESEAAYRRMCARTQNQILSEAQAREIRHLCCKIFTGLCMMSAGGIVSAISGNHPAGIPILPGLPLLGGGAVIAGSAFHNLRKTSRLPGPSSTPDPANLVKRAPPPTPRLSSQPPRMQHFDVETEAAYRQMCARRQSTNLSEAKAKGMRNFCCKFFTGFCTIGAGGALSWPNSAGIPMLPGMPLIAAGTLMAAHAVDEFRTPGRRAAAAAVANDPANLVRRERGLEPRTPPPPSRHSSQHSSQQLGGGEGLEGMTEAEKRRVCAKHARVQPSADGHGDTLVACCKLFTGLCMMGSGGAVVAVTAGGARIGYPLMVTGAGVSLSAAGDLRKARQRKSRPEVASEVRGMVKRRWRVEGEA